jgi:hypothetical protein
MLAKKRWGIVQTFSIQGGKSIMNRKKYVILLVCFIFLTGLIFSLFEAKHEEQFGDFRCNGPTRYFLENESVMVNQDLRVSGPDAAYLTLEGYVSTVKGREKLHRVIYMKNGKKAYKHTWLFNITDIHRAANDTVSDKAFEMFLMELTGDSSLISFDINHISDNLYLIGTPLSYIFTCNGY